MSERPGLDLEDYLGWCYDSFAGLSEEKRAAILLLCEPYRTAIEDWLFDFDEGTQGWRSYASCVEWWPPEVESQIQTIFEAT